MLGAAGGGGSNGWGSDARGSDGRGTGTAGLSAAADGLLVNGRAPAKTRFSALENSVFGPKTRFSANFCRPETKQL